MSNQRAAGKTGSRAVALFCLLVLTTFASGSRLSANTSGANPKSTDVPAEVIAHLTLESPPGNQMVLQRIGDKHYLYIQQAGKQGFVIVNVSKPQYPSFVNRQAKANDATAGSLRMVGSDVGVAEVPDKSAKGTIQSGPSSTETVKILDLTDPAHPKVLQTFKNVTSILGDGARGIIYLANDEGLWVLKHHRAPIAPEKQKKPCDSYSAIAAMPPDCQ